MACCSSSFGLTHVVNFRNEVVSRRIWNQDLIFHRVELRNVVKEVGFPLFCENSRFGHVHLKKKEKLLVMNMVESQGESQIPVAAVTIPKEGGESIVEKTKILETEKEPKLGSGGTGGYGEEPLDFNGGNGNFTNGRGGEGGGGGGGGGGDGGENGEDPEEKEFGPIMKFEAVMKEIEARGATLPSDMLEAAKSVGIRKLLLLRYLDLQVPIWF